jgi:hypothetical protein
VARARPSVSRETVRRVPVRSRELVTVHPDSPLWKGEAASFLDLDGAIVRIRPPYEATQPMIDDVRAWFLRAGASKVTLLPSPRPELLPGAACIQRPKAAASARDAVLQVAREVASKEPERLLELCEKIMGEEGL